MSDDHCLAPNNSRTSRASSGFTLIELLIALTLFGLLAVVLIGGLRFGTRVWETGHGRSAAFFEVEGVQRFLRQQLTQARLTAGTHAAARESQGFEGALDSLVFIAPLPAYVGLAGLYRFELNLSGTNGQHDLVLTWTLYRPDPTDEPDEDSISQRVLLENLDDIEIRYFGRLAFDEGPDWHDTWENPIGLPALIALDLKFPEGDPRRWPGLVVAPFAATSGFSS